jgi:dihydroneopterin aldolase
MDRILLEGMSFYGHHGVYPAEREIGTHFSVDIALELDRAGVGRSDRLEDTLDYRSAHQAVREVMEGEACQLLETLAERAAARLLTLDRVLRATVTVRKRPPLRAPIAAVGVEVTRSR